MDTPNSQIRRLILWNRFWLVLVSLYVLFAGYNFLFKRLTYDVVRLHLNWGYSATVKNERALVFSINQGGPFIVTHLVKQPVGNQSKAVAALPEPILIYQYKSQVAIRPSELARMVWVDEEGKKVLPPKPGQPVIALHYKMLELTTKSTTAN